MTLRSGVKNATVQQVSRRKRALQMLTSQLESGVKTKKGTLDEKIPLTEKDTKRIKKEIENIKAKL